jgi:hypothetical protein
VVHLWVVVDFGVDAAIVCLELVGHFDSAA